MITFHPLEVVDRGSESQLQVDENLNKKTLRVNGWSCGWRDWVTAWSEWEFNSDNLAAKIKRMNYIPA